MMVIVVINTLLALVLFFVAWQLRRLRRWLARTADRLSVYERSSHAALRGTPDAIYIGQQGIHKLRQGNQPPSIELQRVRQVLTLLGLGQRVWSRFMVVRRTQFIQKGWTVYK